MKDKKVNSQTAQHKKAVLEALEKSLGVVTTACKKVGVSRRTFYLWIDNDEDFAEAAKEIKEIAIDFVESSLFKQIKEGSTAATIYYLKTQARSRGYVEKKEHDVNYKGAPPTVNVIFSELENDDGDE